MSFEIFSLGPQKLQVKIPFQLL